MGYDANLSTDKDKVRLLISDVGGQDGNSFIFQDTEVQGFLDLKTNDIFSAAALALRAIAGNTVQVMRRITFLELETNGPEEAKALIALAESLEATADSGITFEVAHITQDDFDPLGLINTP